MTLTPTLTYGGGLLRRWFNAPQPPAPQPESGPLRRKLVERAHQVLEAMDTDTVDVMQKLFGHFKIHPNDTHNGMTLETIFKQNKQRLSDSDREELTELIKWKVETEHELLNYEELKRIMSHLGESYLTQLLGKDYKNSYA